MFLRYLSAIVVAGFQLGRGSSDISTSITDQNDGDRAALRIRACTLVKPTQFPYVIDWIAFHQAQSLKEFILLYEDGEDRTLAYAANQLDMLKRLYREAAIDVHIEIRPWVPGFDLITVCGGYNRDGPNYTLALPDIHHYVLAPDLNITKALEQLTTEGGREEEGERSEEICSLHLPVIKAPVYAMMIEPLSAPKFVAADAATGILDVYYDPRDSKEYQRQFSKFQDKEVFFKFPQDSKEVDALFDSVVECKTECAQNDLEASSIQDIKNQPSPLIPPFVKEMETANKMRELIKLRIEAGSEAGDELLEQLDSTYRDLWAVAYPFTIPKYSQPLAVKAGGEAMRDNAIWQNRRCADPEFTDTEATSGVELKNPDLVILKAMYDSEIDKGEDTDTDVLADLASVRELAVETVLQLGPRPKFMHLQLPRAQIAIPNNIHWECDAGDIWSDRRALCPSEYPYVGQNLHKIPPANPLYVHGWCKKPKEHINREELHAKARQQNHIDQSDLIMCPGWPEVACCDNVLETGVTSIYAGRVDLEKPNPWGSFTPCSNCKVSDKDTLAALAKIRSRMATVP